MKKAGKKAVQRCSKQGSRRRSPANHLREWGRQQLRGGKSWAIVALTHVLARTANGIYDFEQSIERGELPWMKPSPPDAVWEDFYRRPHKMFQQVINHSCPCSDDSTTEESVSASPPQPGLGTFLRSCGIYAKLIQRLGDDEVRRQLRECLATSEGKAAALEMFKLGQEIRQMDIDELFGLNREMDDATYATGIAMPPIQFFILVWIPCLIAHGESPRELFRQAERGSTDAFEKLLQVDKRLLWCPTMAQLFDEASRNRQDGRFAVLMNALSGTPKSFGVGRYKCAVSAYILRMSKTVRGIHPRFGRKMTPSDIRGAFDAAACDRGLLVDEDLPLSRDGYRKAIQRDRTFAYSKAWDTFSV